MGGQVFWSAVDLGSTWWPAVTPKWWSPATLHWAAATFISAVWPIRCQLWCSLTASAVRYLVYCQLWMPACLPARVYHFLPQGSLTTPYALLLKSLIGCKGVESVSFIPANEILEVCLALRAPIAITGPWCVQPVSNHRDREKFHVNSLYTSSAM